MNRRTLIKRIKRPLLCCALLVASARVSSLNADTPKPIPAAEVDESVVASLLHQGIKKPKVVSHIDLTKPFSTQSQWTYIAAQEDDPRSLDTYDGGRMYVCLVKATRPDCAERFQQLDGGLPYHLFASRVVYAGQNQSNALLLVKLCGQQGFDGDCGIVTTLYKYDLQADRFIRVFVNVTGRNNNQDTRFVEGGPLLGDIIVDYPTERAPYTYWIEVYREGKSGQYVQILRSSGRTV
ncbi:MAG: hypothetical protein ACRD3S_09635, partial [Terracidiphilus sp.]